MLKASIHAEVHNNFIVQPPRRDDAAAGISRAKKSADRSRPANLALCCREVTPRLERFATERQLFNLKIVPFGSEESQRKADYNGFALQKPVPTNC